MNTAILLSGGIGTRIGRNIPKQYIEVKGYPIIYYTLKNIIKSESIDALVVVAHDEWHDFISDIVDRVVMEEKSTTPINKMSFVFAKPGRNRQESILNGLRKCVEEFDSTEYVIVHDAVRPMLTSKMIDGYFDSLGEADGLIPVLPMKDTVYICEDGKTISALIDRSTVYAGQAPEIFKLDKYLKANEELNESELLRINGSTEPAVMAGMNIVTVNGDESNFKITTPEDLNRFEEMI